MIVQSNVTIQVKDLKRSIRFYTDVLGLKQGPSSGVEASIDAVGVHICLRSGTAPGRAPGPEGPISIGLRVEDLQAARRTLAARGVRFRKGPSDRGALLEYFSDPDGTPLYLIELKWSGDFQ
jgi:catechol 2,3-dioxygenase-like lactoylglutathione lyase family enzyme